MKILKKRPVMTVLKLRMGVSIRRNDLAVAKLHFYFKTCLENNIIEQKIVNIYNNQSLS